jgi:flagellar motor switch protein FliM
MTKALANNLTKKKMQQLLAAAGSSPKEDAEQVDSTDYNWHEPHYFSSNQLKKLDSFTQKVAAGIAAKFAALCRGDFDVTITSVTQRFADHFFEEAATNEQNDYYLVFSTDKDRRCGLIGVPPQTAIIWVTQLLDDTESEKDSNRGLSQLEESLLLDTASAIVEALSITHGSYEFQPAENIVRELLPLELQNIEELCKITFSIAKASEEESSEAYILIPCRKLEPVVKRTSQTDKEFSSKDISKAVLENLQRMPVSVTTQLASAALTLEEIISLQVNDILLLDKGTDETVEVIVEGKTLFRGQPAKSGSKHAVVITELSHDTE